MEVAKNTLPVVFGSVLKHTLGETAALLQPGSAIGLVLHGLLVKVALGAERIANATLRRPSLIPQGLLGVRRALAPASPSDLLLPPRLTRQASGACALPSYSPR